MSLQEPAPTTYVSTQQVAKALGVGVTTVKRWVDGGLLPALRTMGGHRKLLMTDVVRFVQAGIVPRGDLTQLLPRSSTSDLPDSQSLRAQLIQAVKQSNLDVVRAIILGAHDKGLPMTELADQVIGPAMIQIGDEWHSGKLQIFDEHRATQSVLTALYELQSRNMAPAGIDSPVAVGGASENDHTIMGSLLAKLVLQEAGWDAINLGPHTPMSAFISAMNELQPRLVWISVTHLDDAGAFLKEYLGFYREAEKRGIAIAVGGGALTDELRCKMPYTTYGDHLSHLAAFARILHCTPSRPPRGRPKAGRKKGDRS